MTEPTDAEIEQLYLEETGFDLNDSPAALLDFARAALAKWGQPAHAVEPVAWVWRFSDGSFCETPFETRKACAQDSIGYEGEPVPLYLAPQPVAREPLTDEWIRSRCKESWIFDAAKQWVRMTEAAHGIAHKEGGQHD